jgi:tetratricopeptide (TPR) repeat protein
MDLYEKSYKVKKNYAANLFGIANMYLYKKDYRNALDFYVKASKKTRDNSLALIYASMCYKMLDMTDKSVEYANKAFAKEYVNPEVYYVASKIDDIKKIKYLKKTLTENPLHLNSWLDLTQVSLDSNRLDLAQIYLKPVKYLDANNANYYYYLGLIEKKQGNKDVANQHFKKALEINPCLEDATKAMRSEL